MKRLMNTVWFPTLVCVMGVSGLCSASDIVVQTDQPIGPFNTSWKHLAEWFPRWTPPTYASQIQATDSAFSDWHLSEDSGYYRITISQGAVRAMFPDHYPWNSGDWDFDATGMDFLQDTLNRGRDIQIIFHVLGYPLWLMLPEDTVHPGPFAGWYVGDTKLPIFEGSDSLGLVRYGELITAFCNHYNSMGVDFAMTIMGEPNLPTHWTGTWDDANRYYQTFVEAVNVSNRGIDIKVGGLVWAAGAQAGIASIDTIIDWAVYWHDFCHAHEVRHDFICYHHYWRSPDRFDTVATVFEEAFPDHEFWVTEWNYKFSKIVPLEEYRDYVVGMPGATGNLEFIRHARDHPSHTLMSFFAVIGYYYGYGICHWHDVENWHYTASGHALKWSAGFGKTELDIFNTSSSVQVRASSGSGNMKALMWNHDGPSDSVTLTIPVDSTLIYDCEIWRLDRDSTVQSIFYRPFPAPYGDSAAIDLSVPYCVDRDSGQIGDYVRDMKIDSNEIVYVTLHQTSFLKGDVNFDGTVNILDAIVTIHIILGIHEPTPEEFWAADMDNNDEIDILDVLLIVNTILSP